MTSALREKVFEMLRLHEGCDLCMYLDTQGVITVGIGHALFSSMEAKQLPFLSQTTKKPATVVEILRGWTFLKSQKASSEQRIRYPGVFLAQSADEALFLSDLARFEPVLAATFPEFSSYPETVQLALYDLVFNLGSFRKFPLLTMAVRHRDWAQAAEECHRQKIGEQRNEDTKAQFLSAIVQVARLGSTA